jgi:hypothetical protein
VFFSTSLFVCITVGLGPAKLSGQQLVNYIGAYLNVTYVRYPPEYRICLSNVGTMDIPPDEHWALYFNLVDALHNSELLHLQGLHMFHLDGWMHGIETAFDRLNVTFPGIGAGKSLTLLAGTTLKSRSYAFPRSVLSYY